MQRKNCVTTEADKPTTDKQASDQINTNKSFQYTSRQCRTEESCATGRKQTTECRSRKKSNNRMQIQKKEINPEMHRQKKKSNLRIQIKRKNQTTE
jgi:hypothetical protein